MFVSPSVLATRVAVLTELLSRYHELTDTLTTNGEKGNGDQPPQMPATYTRSVRELERLLGQLRLADRPLWWHVSERYLRSTQSIKERTRFEKVKGKGRVSVTERVVWTTYDARVTEDSVKEGVEWLARHWRLKSEPMLPKVRKRVADKVARFPWDLEDA